MRLRQKRACMSGTYRALDYSFGLRSEDVRFGHVFEQLYEGCAAHGVPETWYEVVHNGRSRSDRELFVDGVRVAGLSDPSWLLGYLMWHVNHEVIARSTAPYVLLHAAAATIDGRAVLLPGAPEAGKTTLVTGLVREGAGYLTDEAVALDPDTLEVVPYAKPVSLDRGAWELFPDLAPRGDLAVHCREQWRIPPEAIRSDAVVGPSRPGLIVFPSYVAGSETAVERLRRPQALLELLRSTFGFHDHPRRNLRLLTRMLADVPAFTVRSGELAGACQAVKELAAPSPAGRR
jgi:hypothetical protein